MNDLVNYFAILTSCPKACLEQMISAEEASVKDGKEPELNAELKKLIELCGMEKEVEEEMKVNPESRKAVLATMRAIVAAHDFMMHAWAKERPEMIKERPDLFLDLAQIRLHLPPLYRDARHQVFFLGCERLRRPCESLRQSWRRRRA